LFEEEKKRSKFQTCKMASSAVAYKQMLKKVYLEKRRKNVVNAKQNADLEKVVERTHNCLYLKPN
jgi:hypothetical protein